MLVEEVTLGATRSKQKYVFISHEALIIIQLFEMFNSLFTKAQKLAKNEKIWGQTFFFKKGFRELISNIYFENVKNSTTLTDFLAKLIIIKSEKQQPPIRFVFYLICLKKSFRELILKNLKTKMFVKKISQKHS